MKPAVLFLSGPYRAKDFPFYRNICRGRYKVAVDGGLRFFRLSEMIPDLLIGDFDSCRTLPKKVSAKTEVVTFPARKDKTDSHLAVEHCLELGCPSIDLVVPRTGEVDHFLGHIDLLRLVARRSPETGCRLITPQYQVVPLEDDEVVFERCVGDRVSLIPEFRQIRVSWSGTEYDTDRALLRPATTRGLRNFIARRSATLRIEGKALLVHYFSG